MITLTIWSDFACPYCYIGETRLQNAIEQLGLQDDVTVDFRAFELDPTTPKEVVSSTPERLPRSIVFRSKVPSSRLSKSRLSGANSASTSDMPRRSIQTPATPTD